MKNKTPRRQVALEEGLSESTVLEIFKRQAKQAVRRPDGGRVRKLGVDEISVRKGHKQYALVLSDLERRKVLAVLPNRRRETFEQWLEGLTERAEGHPGRVDGYVESLSPSGAQQASPRSDRG